MKLPLISSYHSSSLGAPLQAYRLAMHHQDTFSRLILAAPSPKQARINKRKVQ